MKDQKIEINYQLLHEEELTSLERELLNAAGSIAENSPRDKFKNVFCSLFNVTPHIFCLLYIDLIFRHYRL